MSIQGMSQGLSFSNMSYYISERIPGIVPCTTPPLYAQSNAGAYNTTFNMGGTGSNGCAIVVMEVGDTKVTDTSDTPVSLPIGDKIRWEYKGAYGSEYSCCQMGTPRVSTGNDHYIAPTNYTTMVGMGYARGFLGAPYKDGSGNIVNAQTPISTVSGTKLTASTEPTAATAAGGMSNGGRYLAMDNVNNSGNFGNPPTGQTGPLLAYGMFSGDNTYAGASIYNFDNTTSQYVLSADKDFAGPYTGHLETEINDTNINKAYPGSSAVTLNDEPFSTRQAMMVIPIANGGLVNIRSEQFIKGTWASLKIFCPITLPMWGLATKAMGVKEMYTDSDLEAALLMSGGTSIVNGGTTNSTSVTLTVAQINSGGDPPTVGQLVTDSSGNIPQGTVVSAVSGTTLTLSAAASITNGDTLTYHIHPLRRKWQNYANQNNVTLNPNPHGDLINPVTQTDRYNFFSLFGGIVKFNPYPTAADALAHNFNTGSLRKTAYHVPSQNSIYRSQGYSEWKDSSGGSPVANHGTHILGNHASAALKYNTLVSGLSGGSNSEAFHGIPNAHDWVFSRSNGSFRSRLPARGVLDRTRHANNQSGTVGGWYAMRITGYFDAANPTVSSTKIYAVQVGSLDHTRGAADIDVDSVANQVPRAGVIRTIVAA